MKSRNYILMFVLIGLVAACGKDDVDPDGNLIGTWDVVKVEGQQYTNGIPGFKLTDNNPTGYIEFKSNGRGEQNYSFTLFGTVYPANDNFSFSATSDEIVIDLFNEPDMIWTRKVNTSNQQVASYDIPFGLNGYIEYTLSMEK